MDIFERKLVVLGAGWLGKALCLNRLQDNWQVQGTHRSAEHQEEFLRQFVLQRDQLIHQLDLGNAWWVCAMPPRSRQHDNNYQTTLERSLELSQTMNAQGFLLCSSTGVYDPSAKTYDETSNITASGERQQRLLDAEQSVLGAGGKVLRLAGLVGPGREPGRFIAGKQLNSSSQQVVNMVHQQDVINAIVTVLENWQTAAPTYNVVNPEHPSKADYYKQKCAQYGTPAPTFNSDDKAERIINGSAIESLGFNYQFDI